MKKPKLLFLLLIIASTLTFFSCKDAGKSDDDILSGTASVDTSPSESGNFYVYLDTDTDITNGYAKRIVDTFTSPFTPTVFEIDISDVAEGSYYLLAALDIGADNMDPDDPLKWEEKGWYGSSTYNPPASANITDLSGDYDIIMYGLP